MAEKIPQHTHCQICGKAIQADETYCSEECKQKYQTMMKKRKRYIYILYALMIFVIVVVFFMSK